MDLVAIKIKIGLKNNGHCLYPDFNSLPIVQEAKVDWAYYVGQWYYDNKCGHEEVDADSPEGIWYGMLLISEEFADQAVARFPNEVEILTEAETEKFYNERHADDFPDEDIDTKLLEGIKLKKDLGIPLTQDQLIAIDPNNDRRGIRKNKDKTWQQRKQKLNVTIKEKNKNK